METRDQWYKPNLLYNIHWRPPKAPETPKTAERPKMLDPPMAPEIPKSSERPMMIVRTVRFNPSVCTCGEHDCKPHYRMERKVLWIGNERSKGTKENVKRENEMEIHAHLELHSSEKSDINVFNEESCVKEEGINGNSENNADTETDHSDRKGFRGGCNDKDNKELKANKSIKSIGNDRRGGHSLNTKENKNRFGRRGDSFGKAGDEVYSEYDSISGRRKGCFRRKYTNENEGKHRVSFNIDAKSKDLEYDDETNVDCSEDFDKRADEYNRDGKSATELCSYDYDGKVEGQEQVGSDFNSHDAADVLEESSSIARDDHNVGCEDGKAKDVCQVEKKEDGYFDKKGDDENINGIEISEDFVSICDVCLSLNPTCYRERNEIDDKVSSSDNGKEYVKDWKYDHSGRCNGAAEDSGESDLDLILLNGDAHSKNGIHDNEQRFEDEISSAFGILSIYCNSEIHFMVESNWGGIVP